jgi:ABC-type branched-subunit amino acid transport system ATPase component
MFQTIKKVNSQGVAILIVEQNLAQLNGVMKRVYKLEEGQIVGQHSETVCNHS